MRRRRRRPYDQPHPPLDVDRVLRGGARSEVGPSGRTWTVRQVSGGEKAYTCPGCHRQIPPGTAHVVAWQADHLFGDEAGLADRRHWHTGCWQPR